MNIQQSDLEIWCTKHAPPNCLELYDLVDSERAVSCSIPLCDYPPYWCTKPTKPVPAEAVDLKNKLSDFSTQLETVCIHQILLEYKPNQIVLVNV